MADILQASEVIRKLKLQDNEGNSMWEKFFCNVALVQEVSVNITLDDATAILTVGYTWTGAGLNTTTACKRLYEVTGVALVNHEWAAYRDAFLYSLALQWCNGK